jgi:tRNA A37 N6-isopentenylltransferase MiaA
MSEYLHEMDKRKVVNALFKYFKMLAIQDGKAVSLLKQSDVVQTTSKLRFLPVLVWLQAERSILEKRVSRRIQTMVKEKQGKMTGLEEAFFVLDSFVGEHDFSKGVLQAIGYKEFYEYYQQEPTLNEKDKAEKLDEAIAKLC